MLVIIIYYIRPREWHMPAYTAKKTKGIYESNI